MSFIQLERIKAGPKIDPDNPQFIENVKAYLGAVQRFCAAGCRIAQELLKVQSECREIDVSGSSPIGKQLINAHQTNDSLRLTIAQYASAIDSLDQFVSDLNFHITQLVAINACARDEYSTLSISPRSDQFRIIRNNTESIIIHIYDVRKIALDSRSHLSAMNASNMETRDTLNSVTSSTMNTLLARVITQSTI